ncbi:MAG: family 43 glycosylhydrolase [Cyclobacteriaceae bacterium]|nr:family 43 glycosylhydrolase [Cyclobacteriaceae bacterium]
MIFLAIRVEAQENSRYIAQEIKYNQFTPGEIWYDTDGNPINAHAGGILFHEGKYYWFGQIMVPGNGGSDAWVGVSCYSSTDLYNWKNLGVVLSVEDDPSHPLTRGCKIERPKVIYNASTGKFIMWWHHDIKGQGHRNAMTGIAVSEGVEGPYEFIRVFRPLAEFLPSNIPESLKDKQPDPLVYTFPFTGGSVPNHPDSLLIFKRDLHQGQMARDMTLFVDEDGAAYHIYSSEENSTLHIAELSEDYLGYTGKYIRIFPGRFMEAPALFKRGSQYYFIGSGCTGWAPNAARSAVASSIWGPWEELGNPCTGADAELTFYSQSTFILPVADTTDAFIFMADRWHPENPVEGRYVWLPVQFEGKKVALKWHDSWDLNHFKPIR